MAPLLLCGRAQLGAAQCRPGRPSRSVLSNRPAALFGWGGGASAEDKADKAAAKEEEFRYQQELLEKRRSGVLIREANDRRRKVAEELASRKQLRQSEKDALARGEMPDTLQGWKPYDAATARKADGKEGGIIVPLLPFGIGKYDEGERFDLRSPYSDAGWVDPDEQDMWAGLKKIGTKILNFSGKSQDEYLKPVVWATPYTKRKGEEGKAPPAASEPPKKKK